MAVVHRRVVYSGRVQGVGFRATTCSLASGYPVSGYVKNLPDGAVELVASGDSAEVAQFLDAIRREFDSKIRNQSESDYFWDSNEPSGFSIRY